MYPSILPRFLRYVKIDTQSDYRSKTQPSTAKQWQLLRLLADELRQLGLQDVELTANGYVLATIPATSAAQTVLALSAHVDTAMDYSGTDVKPIVHENYQGQVLELPLGGQILDPKNPLYADLLTAVGKDVVTASGDTLLGADDKAGVTILMALTEHLLAHPEIPHGKIRIVFTPDEEIGRGVEGITLEEIAADYAYTIDGGAVGELNWETFSADGAVVRIEGVSTHPGEAHTYGMVNAVHLAGKLLAMLPRETASPESTTFYGGFIHPLEIHGNSALTELRFILRDHDDAKLAAKGDALRAICAALQASYPTSQITCKIEAQYRNMGNWLRNDMRPVEKMLQACERAGIAHYFKPVRGGTDGSRLTERGLLTPNIFCGGHNAHGPKEWVAVQDMARSVDMLVELVQLWD